MEKEKLPAIPEEIIISKLSLVRGQKVMPDRVLAGLYGVETKRLKEAVRRNIERFPDDFMFAMMDLRPLFSVVRCEPPCNFSTSCAGIV